MAVEITILRVKEKLSLVKGNKISAQLQQSIDKLSEVYDFLQNDPSYGSLNHELLKAVDLAEDAIDTFLCTKAIQKEKVSAYICLTSVFMQTNFMNRMEKLVGEISRQSRNRPAQTPSNNVGVAEQPEPTFNVYSDKKTGIFSSEDSMEELRELILNRDPSDFHISVVEYGSTTKALLKIYNDENIKNHFECRAWVHVSEEFDKRKLLFDIFKQVTRESEVMENLHLDSLQQDLCRLLIEKIYLVVLIDVRTPNIWEILKFVLPNSSNGSRVVFSFREADAERFPNIRFFGREISLDSEHIMQVATTKSKNVEADTVTVEPDVSDEVAQRLEGAFDYLDKETDIVGMRDKILELAKLTLSRSDKYFLISVVGREGSGRTTLVQIIYNNPYIRQNFDCCAWTNVYVSQDYDTRNILIEILKQVARVKDVEGLSQEKLEDELTIVFSQKRFLLVLDDVHLPGAWYDLQRIFPSSSSGSRVILITSDAFIARSFSPSIFILKVNPLQEDEGWKLFLKKVRGDASNRDLMNLRETIWKTCHGLPLLICVLGGLLFNKENLGYSDWSKVINQIIPREKKKEMVVEHNDQKDLSLTGEYAGTDEDHYISTDLLVSLDKHGPSYIWTLGYRDLSPHLKACLDYIYLFPKSYEIPVRRLLQLWLAERLPREGTEISPEDQVQRDFEELKQRSMIEVAKWRSDGTPKTCRVPSSLYDTFFPRAEKMGFFHIHGKSDSASGSLNIRRLAEHLGIQHNPPSDNRFKNLHSYISFNTRKGDKPSEVIGNFLNSTIIKRGVGLLRVLDLEHVYKPVLPETIEKLKLLRYLGLRWTFLDAVPKSIGDLPCLETLDVKHTNITTLPMSIWRTKTLRHLYLNEIHLQMPKKSCPPSPLTNLQTLWGLLIGSQHSPIDWLKSLSSLIKLGLTCHTTSLPKITDWIQGLTNLQSLRLRSINDFAEPSDLNLVPMDKHVKLTELYLLGKFPEGTEINQLPPKMKILTLSMSQLSKDPMPTLGILQNLKILKLFAHSYIGEEMTCVRGGFPELRVLKLWVLSDLKEWTVEEGAMPVLKELEIRYCPKLKKPNGLENVTTLKELILTNMENHFAEEVERRLGKNTVIIKNNWTLNRPWV